MSWLTFCNASWYWVITSLKTSVNSGGGDDECNESWWPEISFEGSGNGSWSVWRSSPGRRYLVHYFFLQKKTLFSSRYQIHLKIGIIRLHIPNQSKQRKIQTKIIFFYKKIFRSCICPIRRGEGAFSSDQGEINTEVQIFSLVFFFQKLPTKGGRYGSRVPTHLSSGARPTGSPNPPKSTPPWKGAGSRIF